MEHHVSGSDPWTIPETTARDSWYGGGSSIPDVWVDGKYEVLGASDCNSAYNNYLSRYNMRMSETGGNSPVGIEGTFTVFGTAGSFNATYTLLDPYTLGSVRATLFVYEEGLTYGSVTYNHVTRVIKDQTITTLINQGDQATLSIPFTAGAGWVANNLHGVAILQQTTGQKTIIQAARLTFLTDFSVTMASRIASVPEGDGWTSLQAQIKNRSAAGDVLTVSVDDIVSGWDTYLQVAGSPDWVTTTDLALDAGQTVDVTIWVRTDATTQIGTEHLITHSANSDRTQSDAYRVFNGSPSIFFVSDDMNAPYEVPFINAMNNLGYLFDHWDVYTGHGGTEPGLTDMAGFDAVIWQHGYVSNTISNDAVNALMDYMDSGGSFYYPGMDYLSSVPPGGVFQTDYLGVASFTISTRCHTASGVAGDPVTNGMTLPLTFEGGEPGNRVDTVNPIPGATAIFFSEGGNPNAIRHELPSGGRVVFSTIVQNAISTSDPAPNNSQTVIQRVLEWLCAPDPAATPDPLASSNARILGTRPNPMRSTTELTYDVSSVAAASPVTLRLSDPAGRIVRTLVDGKMGAGTHHASWDGRDDAGRPVCAGVYLVHFSSLDGQSTAKLVLVK